MFASTKIISKRKEWTSEILISWQCRKMEQTVSLHMIATQNRTDLSFSHHSQCVTRKLSTKQKVSLKLNSLKSPKSKTINFNKQIQIISTTTVFTGTHLVVMNHEKFSHGNVLTKINTVFHLTLQSNQLSEPFNSLPKRVNSMFKWKFTKTKHLLHNTR